MKFLISGNYPNSSKKRKFGGESYNLHSYHYDKAFANQEVKKQRDDGQCARLLRAGQNKRGWNVYTKKRSK
jgi:adenine-specific DNA methylase